MEERRNPKIGQRHRNRRRERGGRKEGRKDERGAKGGWDKGWLILDREKADLTSWVIISCEYLDLVSEQSIVNAFVIIQPRKITSGTINDVMTYV